MYGDLNMLETIITEATFFSIWISFHEHSRFIGQQGNGEAISVTPLYHFHSLHRHLVHLEIILAITTEILLLHIAIS